MTSKTQPVAPPSAIAQLDLASQYAAIGGEIRAAIERVLASQQFILGREGTALESEIADQHDDLTEERIEMSNKKILIVDDDPDMRLGLNVRLKANHYDVIFAADGMASIAEARKHNPDLIILDLGLPAGDGFSVMDRLKANDSLALIPIIVLSARDPSANQQRALNAGAKAFLQKPVDNARLLAVIRQALGEPAAPPKKPAMHDLGSL